MSCESFTPRSCKVVPSRLYRDLLGNRNETDDLHPAINEFSQLYSNRLPDARQQLTNLLPKIACSPNMLAQALRDIDPRRLYGSEVDEMGSKNWMNSWMPSAQVLSSSILDGTFQPGKYRKVQIPKIGKAGTRTIEIPGNATRIIARSVSNLLLPIVDQTFRGWNFWSRPGVSACHGMAVLGEFLEKGYCFVVTADIADAFGVLPRTRAFEAVAHVVDKSPIVELLALLSDRSRTIGVPQGVSTSPLIMNTFLDQHLDKWWVSDQRKTKLLRYADDILIACKTLSDAKAAYDTLVGRMDAISTPIKQESNFPVCHLTEKNDSVVWLGFKISGVGRTLRMAAGDLAWENLRGAIESYRYGQEADDAHCSDRHAAEVAYAWFRSKAIAFKQASLPATAERIRDVLDSCGFEPDVIDDGTIEDRWVDGHSQWIEAKKQAQEWVKAKKGVPYSSRFRNLDRADQTSATSV